MTKTWRRDEFLCRRRHDATANRRGIFTHEGQRADRRADGGFDADRRCNSASVNSTSDTCGARHLCIPRDRRGGRSSQCHLSIWRTLVDEATNETLWRGPTGIDDRFRLAVAFD